MKKQFVMADMEIGTIDVMVEGYVYYSIDTAYGADADGNRGTRTIIVEDVRNVQAIDHSYDVVGLTKEDYDRACELLTRTFLES